MFSSCLWRTDSSSAPQRTKIYLATTELETEQQRSSIFVALDLVLCEIIIKWHRWSWLGSCLESHEWWSRGGGVAKMDATNICSISINDWLISWQEGSGDCVQSMTSHIHPFVGQSQGDWTFMVIDRFTDWCRYECMDGIILLEYLHSLAETLTRGGFDAWVMTSGK